jgi:hypothetical protein
MMCTMPSLRRGRSAAHEMANGPVWDPHREDLTKLGFRRNQPDVLRRALLQHAADNTVSSVQLTPFGAKYLIEGQISGPTGTAAAIRSVWFVESGERGPRFVTAYPLRGMQK